VASFARSRAARRPLLSAISRWPRTPTSGLGTVGSRPVVDGALSFRPLLRIFERVFERNGAKESQTWTETMAGVSMSIRGGVESRAVMTFHGTVTEK